MIFRKRDLLANRNFIFKDYVQGLFMFICSKVWAEGDPDAFTAGGAALSLMMIEWSIELWWNVSCSIKKTIKNQRLGWHIPSLLIWYDMIWFILIISYYNLINAVYSLKLGETDAKFGMISCEEAPAAEDQFDEEDEEAWTIDGARGATGWFTPNKPFDIFDIWMMTQHCYNSLICTIYLFDNIVCI